MSVVILAVVLASALLAGVFAWRNATQSFTQPWDVAPPTAMGRREYQRWVRASRKRRRLFSTALSAFGGATAALALLLLLSLSVGHSGGT
jgi:hypothetical protein